MGPVTTNKTLLARDTYLALVRLHDRLEGEFAALFREAGLTGAQYNVLRILCGAPKAGASCQAIGDRLLTRVPDVTRLVDRMCAAGFVTRERSEDDRRVVLVRVTAKGRRQVRELEEPVLDLHRRQFDHLSAARLEDLLSGLEGALDRG